MIVFCCKELCVLVEGNVFFFPKGNCSFSKGCVFFFRGGFFFVLGCVFFGKVCFRKELCFCAKGYFFAKGCVFFCRDLCFFFLQGTCFVTGSFFFAMGFVICVCLFLLRTFFFWCEFPFLQRFFSEGGFVFVRCNLIILCNGFWFLFLQGVFFARFFLQVFLRSGYVRLFVFFFFAKGFHCVFLFLFSGWLFFKAVVFFQRVCFIFQKIFFFKGLFFLMGCFSFKGVDFFFKAFFS